MHERLPAPAQAPGPAIERGLADWIVTIASSAGGLRALLEVLPALPPSFGAAVVCVQHLSPLHPSHLVEILTRRCSLPPSFVEDRMPLRTGDLIVAAPDRHILIAPGPTVDTSDAPPINYVRPAADVLFESAARVFGRFAIGVVLSGMGRDGAEGVKHIREAGGTVIVQSPRTAEFPAMPRAAMALVTPDYELPLEGIARCLCRLVPEVVAI